MMLEWLTAEEARRGTESFLHTIYGEEAYKRWVSLKLAMNFTSEREFITWLMDLVQDYTQTGWSGDEVVGSGGEMSGDKVGRSGDKVGRSGDKVRMSGDDVRVSGHEVRVSGDVMKVSEDKVMTGVFRSDEVYIEDTACSIKGVPMVDLTAVDDYVLQPNERKEDLCSAGGDYDTDFSFRWNSDDANHDGANSDDANSDDANYDDTASRPWSCPHCFLRFKYQRNLAPHISTVHDKQRRFSCSFCNHRASTRANIHIHQVLKHGLKTDFQCPRCHKYLTNAKMLSKHEAKCRPS